MKHQIPAVSLLVITPNKRISILSGTTQLDGKKPITKSNLFGVGSITKTFISAMILKLEANGKLNINDRLGKFLPEYKKWQNVSLKEKIYYIQEGWAGEARHQIGLEDWGLSYLTELMFSIDCLHFFGFRYLSPHDLSLVDNYHKQAWSYAIAQTISNVLSISQDTNGRDAAIMLCIQKDISEKDKVKLREIRDQICDAETLINEALNLREVDHEKFTLAVKDNLDFLWGVCRIIYKHARLFAPNSNLPNEARITNMQRYMNYVVCDLRNKAFSERLASKLPLLQEAVPVVISVGLAHVFKPTDNTALHSVLGNLFHGRPVQYVLAAEESYYRNMDLSCDDFFQTHKFKQVSLDIEHSSKTVTFFSFRDKAGYSKSKTNKLPSLTPPRNHL